MTKNTGTADLDGLIKEIAVAYAGRQGTTPADIIALVRSLKAEFGMSGGVQNAIPSTSGDQETAAEANEEFEDNTNLLDFVSGMKEEPAPAPAQKESTPQPAVAIEDSVKVGEITCMECGKGFSMLRKHLSTIHNMSTDEYSKKWGLSANYPFIAPRDEEELANLPPLAQDKKTTSSNQIPAVPVEKTVTDEKIYCMECGEGFTMIKRHLRTAHNMTPAEYRQKWDLPEDYPMAAPAFSKIKSKIAERSGLGKRKPSGS